MFWVALLEFPLLYIYLCLFIHYGTHLYIFVNGETTRLLLVEIFYIWSSDDEPRFRKHSCWSSSRSARRCWKRWFWMFYEKFIVFPSVLGWEFQLKISVGILVGECTGDVSGWCVWVRSRPSPDGGLSVMQFYRGFVSGSLLFGDHYIQYKIFWVSNSGLVDWPAGCPRLSLI